MKLIWLAVFAVIYAHLPARAGVIDFEGLPDMRKVKILNDLWQLSGLII